MPVTRLSAFEMGDTYAQFQLDTESRQVGLLVVPSSLREEMVPKRKTLAGAVDPDLMRAHPGAAQGAAVDSLIQIKAAGDPPTRPLSAGVTLRNSFTTLGLRFEGQNVLREPGARHVITRLSAPHSIECEHHLLWHTDERAIRLHSRVINLGDHPVSLELLSSFSLTGITPFATDDAPGRLRVHRFPSVWGAEARPESTSVERLHLRRGWAVACERFGHAGTMPARSYFPMVAIEDDRFGVFWGAQLACVGPWQIEIYRDDDCIALSGGLADREFGHWLKTLAPGESFTSPPATVAVVRGNLDSLCERIVRLQQRDAERAPEIESDLPVILNEWATSWGNPDARGIASLAERASGSGIGTMVIDAGWHASRSESWETRLGDWTPHPDRFPDGLAPVARAIRDAGLLPGIALELESCTEGARAFSLEERLLRRDGTPIEIGGRRFLDLRHPDTIAHLRERVDHLIEHCGFGYLKIDSRESPGVGVDGAESPGEGLRAHAVALHGFLQSLRERFPDLVLECAAPGGFRLEPATLGLPALGSFSDARESLSLPIVAANLHRLMLPRQLLLWTVLHAGDTDERLRYTLATAFLGRMCLSGEITRLNGAQWAIVKDAISLYRCVTPILRSGRDRRFGPDPGSYRHPVGWQAILRTLPGERIDEALLVCHAFSNPSADGEPIRVEIPGGGAWEIGDALNPNFPLRATPEGAVILSPQGEFSAQVAILRRVGR